MSKTHHCKIECVYCHKKNHINCVVVEIAKQEGKQELWDDLRKKAFVRIVGEYGIKYMILPLTLNIIKKRHNLK